jgi:hypothetical protein
VSAAALTFASDTAPQWEQVEQRFEIAHTTANPYEEVEAYVEYVHSSGETIRRPAFWDGGDVFKVRFASTRSEGEWTWKLQVDGVDKVRGVTSGRMAAVPARSEGLFSKHGFWRIPKGSRHLQHVDGRSCVMVADTPWAIPWRATLEEVKVYAADRQRKGYNAALLMTVQPDKGAVGPRDRLHELGFAVGFEDLPTGHIRQLNADYFQYLDQLIEVLRMHDIVPVFQPVFHGFGWKGLQTAGNDLVPEEYARFCRYLVARYGAGPSIWLVGGDGIGNAPSIDPAGQEIEAWDDYQHPAGMHYAPHGITDSHQAASWLDFQWAQTGHNGEHLPEVTMALFHQQPVKAVANGEPTYEHIGRIGNGAGWWQGHEAWSNLCSGGTMGVVYGAGSLWSWVRNAEENDAEAWSFAPGKGWRDALDFEGSVYVGNLGKILNRYDLKGALPDWRIAPSRRALWVPGELLVVYLGNGGGPWFANPAGLPPHYHVYDPVTGERTHAGDFVPRVQLPGIASDSREPRVIVFYQPSRLLEP